MEAQGRNCTSRAVDIPPKSHLADPFQQMSPLEILVLDGSPKPIRRRTSVSQSMSHEDEEFKPPLTSHDLTLEVESLLARPTFVDDHPYDNDDFQLPVKGKVFSSQDGLYEEVYRDDGSAHIYDLEKPTQEIIPKKLKDTKNINAYPTHKSVKTSETEAQQQHNLSMSVENPYYVSICPRVLPTNTAATHKAPSVPILPTSAKSNLNDRADKKSAVMARTSVLSIDDSINTDEQWLNKRLSVMSTSSISIHTNKEENVAYLKTLSLSNILQLLDNMNLGQHKGRFKEERIDGEIIVHLDKGDLVELGVTKNIHQTRLLRLIDGTMSAKKYQHDT